MASWFRQALSFRQPCGRRVVAMMLILLFSYGFILVRSTLVLRKEIAIPTSSAMGSCTRYFCVKESYPTRNKRCGRQRRRHDDFIRKLQKKICEKIYSLIKMRLRIKEFNIDSPCND